MRKEVIAHKNPKSPISEIYRTLRTNIQFMDTNKKMKTLLITSTYAGEGKSWTTANLAVTFAQTGKKVILVDADMRKGRQYAIFGASPKPGLSNYLSQAVINENGKSTESLEGYIQETEVPNLYLITSGNIPPNPSELLVSAQMINLIEDLKQICDIVIFDGTPCELVADSIILSRLVDSTIIIAAHKKTKKDALERVIKNIQNVGGKLDGVVLNRMPMKKKEYGYYYGSKDAGMKKSSLKKRNEFNERIDNKIMDLQKEIMKEQANEIESSKTIISENKNDQISEINTNDVSNNNINNTGDYTSNNNINDASDYISKNNISDISESNCYYQSENNNSENIINNNKIIEEKGNDFLEKTNEILRQINDYIDKEKNKLK